MPQKNPVVGGLGRRHEGTAAGEPQTAAEARHVQSVQGVAVEPIFFATAADPVVVANPLPLVVEPQRVLGLGRYHVELVEQVVPPLLLRKGQQTGSLLPQSPPLVLLEVLVHHAVYHQLLHKSLVRLLHDQRRRGVALHAPQGSPGASQTNDGLSEGLLGGAALEVEAVLENCVGQGQGLDSNLFFPL